MVYSISAIIVGLFGLRRWLQTKPAFLTQQATASPRFIRIGYFPNILDFILTINNLPQSRYLVWQYIVIDKIFWLFAQTIKMGFI